MSLWDREIGGMWEPRRPLCVWTDHHLIISQLSVRIQSKTKDHRVKKAPKWLNITKLKDIPTKQLFVEALDEWLHTILLDEQDVKAAWITLRDTVYSTAKECLRPSTRRCRDWFEENHAKIMDLIGKKCAAYMAHLHYSQCIGNIYFLYIYI